MKKMKKSPNLGTAKYSAGQHQCQNFKNEESSHKTNDISKYFNSIPPQNLNSPYKKTLNDIKYEPFSDDLHKDFKTPRPMKTQMKNREKKLTSKKQHKSKAKLSSTSRNPLLKCTRENFGLTDVNPNHLQMALALSKSTYAIEYPNSSKNSEDSFPVTLTPEKNPSKNNTLENFGFKCKSKLTTDLRRNMEPPKINKNSKFRFVTPTLKSRTVEDRQSIISSKISLILNRSTDFSREIKNECLMSVKINNLCSEILQNMRSGRSILAMNGYNTENKDNKYYIKEMNIPPNKSKCGYLLKKWDNIPGRDKSPLRNESNDIECKKLTTTLFDSEIEHPDNINQEQSDDYSAPQSLCMEYSNRNCISPDLFESDTEDDCILQESRKLPHSIFSPLKIMDCKLSVSDDEVNDVNLKKAVPHLEEEKDAEELCINSSMSKVHPYLTDNLLPKTVKTNQQKHSVNELLVENEDGLNLICLNGKIESDNTIQNDNLNKIAITGLDTIPEKDGSFSKHNHTSLKELCDLEDTQNGSGLLNVTDYMNQILNQDNSKIVENDEYDESGDRRIISNETVENIRANNNLKTDEYGDNIEFASSQESCSQESIIVSDEELNYSSLHSLNTSCNRNVENENNLNSLDIDEITHVQSVLKLKYGNKEISTPLHNRVSELKGTITMPKMYPEEENTDANVTFEDEILLEGTRNEAYQKIDESSRDFPKIHPNVDPSQNYNTPEKYSAVSSNTNNGTPDNIIIKTRDVTPLANYDEMDTPRITKELQKFGLKPLKRRRGVKLLKYLYECTHPVIGSEEIDSDENDQNKEIKKRKILDHGNSFKDFNPIIQNQDCIEIIGDSLLQNEKLDDLIFERKLSVKISTCRIPLQIVWHNFLAKNSNVKENILLYEPLQLEVLHQLIKEQTGCKFNIQDLLTFFDKKCITIRTAQGSQKKPGIV